MRLISIQEQAVPLWTACFHNNFGIVTYIGDVEDGVAKIVLDDFEIPMSKNNLYDLELYKAYITYNITECLEEYCNVYIKALKTAYNISNINNKCILQLITAEDINYSQLIAIEKSKENSFLNSKYIKDTLKFIKTNYKVDLTEKFYVGYYIYLYKDDVFLKLFNKNKYVKSELSQWGKDIIADGKYLDLIKTLA